MQTNSVKHHIRNCMKGLFLVVLLSCLFVGTSCSDVVDGNSPEGKKNFFPARYKGLWGYIDRTGKMVIEPQFLNAETFSEGKAPVCVEVNRVRKWGFIDEKGEMVFEPQFERASSFSEGLAAVLVDSLWGYIDHHGELVIEPKFGCVGPFHYGRAYFKNDYYFGFINRKGDIVIEPQFDMVEDFYDGLAAVRVGLCSIGKYGYIDTTGNWAILPMAENALSFRNGIGVLQALNHQVVFFNTEGKILDSDKYGKNVRDANLMPMLPSATDSMTYVPSNEEMHQNLLSLYARREGGVYRIFENQLWGFADSLKNIIAEPQFFSVSPFRNGLSKVVFKDWKMGYIDQKGNIIYKEK
ncbi:MAG: WG repeat-containing protein [Bacteroidales bacterium]|nr:WG repeat-containing protein [Bacteroidales bacterium]